MRISLNSRPFFNNQLAILLEDQEEVGTHEIAMMIHLPDFSMSSDTWGHSQTEEQFFSLMNPSSTFTMRYPGALSTRYHRGDFATLLPHRTLKEVESIAGQLIKAVDTLPNNRTPDRDDMIHIGVRVWRSGQDTEQVMEHAGSVTRNVGLQSGDSWATHDDSLPGGGRGNVRWRTLIEQTLSRDDSRPYQKPVVAREGRVHHREFMCRTLDDNEEVNSAEYTSMVLQFGLPEEYDRLLISRLTPLLHYRPEGDLTTQVVVESPIRPRFQCWLCDMLMRCKKS